MSLQTFVEDGSTRLRQLLSAGRAKGPRSFHIRKVHPAEISAELLTTLGFNSAGRHLLYAAQARSE